MTHTKTIFIDTNDYLHFTFFTEIDWPALLETKSVKIIVPPVIMRELEDKKFNSRDEAVKRRAQKVTARLAQLFKSREHVRPQTAICFESQEPHEEISTLLLNRDSKDDQLLASIFRYRSEHPDEHVLLATRPSINR